MAFRQKDADSCAVELTPYNSGGDGLSADEAEAALDSIPSKLAEALKAVNVESKCVRDQVRGIIEAGAWGKRQLELDSWNSKQGWPHEYASYLQLISKNSPRWLVLKGHFAKIYAMHWVY